MNPVTLQIIGPPAATSRSMRRWPRRTSRRRAVAAVAAMLVALSACTVHENQHYQVDLVPAGYHVHVYRKTTTVIWYAHITVCNSNPRCTLDKIREVADLNGIIARLAHANRFFEDHVHFGQVLNSVPRPVPFSVNRYAEMGCLGGFKNLVFPWMAPAWYADPPSAPWCKVGA